MNRKITKRRLLRRIAASAALIIILIAAFPVTNVLADYTIDDSEFKDIAKSCESKTVYVWHKGKPPATVDHTGYPVVMAWDGQYYFDLRSDVTDTLIDISYNFRARTRNKLLEDNNAYNSGSKNAVKDDDYKIARYINWQYYFGNPVTSLPMNFATLRQYGTGLSYSLPDVPYFYAAQGSRQTAQESYYGIRLGTENEWMCSMLSQYAKVDTMPITGWDDYEHFSLDFLLDYPVANVQDFLSNKNVTLKYRDYNASANKSVSTTLEQRTWDVRLESDGQYSFRQACPSIDRKRRHSDSWACSLQAYWADVRTVTGKMELFHEGQKWGAHGYSYGGTTGDSKGWKFDKEYITSKAENSNWAFELYYATTMPMSFLKGNFTVKNGQTVNLNGPLSINEGVTVTVEDGGVLVASGWVVNNGKIKVKKGGTLMVMSTEDSKGVISTYNSTPNEPDGAILCDGTIIVMPGCKIQSGGNTGIRLGSTAQVVNYGTIMATQLMVMSDYTIENRASDSWVLVGYDVVDGGFVLTVADVTVTPTGVSYPGQGIIQSFRNARIPSHGVYGTGRDNIAYNMVPGYSSIDYDKNAASITNKYYAE